MSGHRLDFYGENITAYESREPEVLLAGPAGTGKSVVLLAKCLTILGKYPGCRGLFCRGTRTSLTQSGLVTWEDDVLGKDHPVLTRNPVKRRVRQSYEFANGSEFVVAGLDDPGKTLSAQYDFVYIQEATEEGITFDVYETLLRLLRNGKVPYQIIFMDCNPTTPVSWLYKRSAEGGFLKRYTSRHEDNPRFYHHEKGEWTEDGKRYLDTLKRMTGARLARFFIGRWQAAEGLVYDGFREDIHMPFPAGWTPDPYWPQSWSIDWGDKAPTVVLVWAQDGDGRLYLIREYYLTHTRSDVMGKMLADAMARGELKRPVSIVADHNEEKAYLFGQVVGMSVDKADKVDRDKGIQQTQARFDVQEDGKPRIFFARDSRRHDADPELDTGMPASLNDELVGYIWNPKAEKDEPIEKDDHAMDAMRYQVRWADANGPGHIAAFVAANAPRVGRKITDSLPRGTFQKR